MLACLGVTLTASAEPGPRTKIVPALQLAAARTPGDLRFIVRFHDGDAPRLSAGAPASALLAARAAGIEAQAAATKLLARPVMNGGARSFRSLWFIDAVAVRGSRALMDEIAALPEVASVEPDELWRTSEAPAAPAAGSSGWGVARVGAPQAWQYGVTGAGVTVGIIDTGVQWDHPALKARYRGWNGTTVDHNYNWFDAISDQPVPFDLDGHGTHVTGIAVGEGGIGVAPGARFIAARGCNIGSCYASALLEAMQWMLAPTDLAGANPDPSKAPQVVSNSWGGSCGNTFFRDAVIAWRNAGITPVFANGNSGPNPGTVAAPACYPEAIGVGAVDDSDMIAPFSARGPAADGTLKPLLTAPGVNINSSIPGGDFTFASGTSMAAPLVAGAVALLEQAKPGITVEQVTEALASRAVDLGDAGDDNTYGAGRIDAFASVLAVKPPPATTAVSGVVRDGDGKAIAGATVQGPGASAVTNPDGGFTLALPPGKQTLSASASGRKEQEQAVTIGVLPVEVTFNLPPLVDHVPVVTGFILTAHGTDSARATPRPLVNVAFTPREPHLVAAYMVLTNGSRPSADDSRWSKTPPTTAWLEGRDGLRMAYLWVKDIGGNIARVAADGIVLDARAPAARFERLESRRLRHGVNPIRILRGRASDNGSGVAMVEIALRRDVKGGCEWWQPARRVFRPGSCATPTWFTPRGLTSWRYELQMPSGTYKVMTRARDRAGNLSDTKNTRSFRRLAVFQ